MSFRLKFYLAACCASAGSTSSCCPEGPGLRRVKLCRPANATSFDFLLGLGNAIFYITNGYFTFNEAT